MAAVDKTYGDALFSLITEEDEKALPDILGQLKGVSEVFAAEPDFIKLLRTPTILIEEKTGLIKEVFDGKVSCLTFCAYLPKMTDCPTLNGYWHTLQSCITKSLV